MPCSAAAAGTAMAGRSGPARASARTPSPGFGATPLGVESAGRKRPDLDGNGKADVLLETGRGYIVLMEGADPETVAPRRPSPATSKQ